MKIGFDFDGVIADSLKLKVLGAKKLYNINIPPEEFKKEIVVNQKKYLTIEEYRDLQDYIYNSAQLSDLMDIVPEADIYLQKLSKSNHSLRIITSRDGKTLKLAQDWLEEKDLDLEIEGVGQGFSKAPACQGLDIYIDDDLEKLITLVDIVPNRWLFSWEYNREVEVKKIACRVDSWKQIYNLISRKNPTV